MLHFHIFHIEEIKMTTGQTDISIKTAARLGIGYVSNLIGLPNLAGGIECGVEVV
jgi:hypothetical protein